MVREQGVSISQVCREMKLTESKGNCWDNAVMERFFLNLKMERVWQTRYANHAEAKQDITDYIVNFYNSTRLPSTLGYRSPAQYEVLANTAAQLPACA